MACEQQVDFYINHPVIGVFGYLTTITKIANFKVDYVDPQNFRIHLSSSASLISWGEDIVISFYDAMNGGTRIIANSKPKLVITLIDYGKNRKNLEEIQQYIGSLYRN